ncbi:hypothetical protein J8J27_23590, partial [Mycobacterium tuberculosis]|nr:hypothetical protein [Mycobacterium tuberculosis]
TGGQGIADGLREGRFDPQLMRDVVTVAATESEAAHAAIRGAKARVRDLDIDIERLKSKLDEKPDASSPTVAASIAVTSRGSGPVALKLEYRLAGAGWTPVYEARLTTGSAGAKPAVAFAIRANV